MIKAQGGIFGWVSARSKMLAAFAAAKGLSQEIRIGERAIRAPTTEFKPEFWTPGDWNAFFGFGTNILVNMLTLTGLLRFVLKMPDELVFSRILPALGLMMCMSTFYYAWLAYRLAKKTGRTDVCAFPRGSACRTCSSSPSSSCCRSSSKTGDP